MIRETWTWWQNWNIALHKNLSQLLSWQTRLKIWKEKSNRRLIFIYKDPESRWFSNEKVVTMLRKTHPLFSIIKKQDKNFNLVPLWNIKEQRSASPPAWRLYRRTPHILIIEPDDEIYKKHKHEVVFLLCSRKFAKNWQKFCLKKIWADVYLLNYDLYGKEPYWI